MMGIGKTGKRRGANSRGESRPFIRKHGKAAFASSLLRAMPLVLAIALPAVLAGCYKSADPPAPQPASTSGLNAQEILKRYLAITDSKDSTIKMRARITDSVAASPSPVQVDLTIYRKRSADGGQTMLVEFNAEERDRSTLVTIAPQGEVEGVRYVQSNDTFVTTKGVTTEEALFGMTMQELADGQPEKYDFELTGEASHLTWQVYRLEGKLKEGVESKFPRVVLLISKESFAALAAEFYDTQDELARRLTVDEGETRAGYWTRLKWTLHNLARKKTIDFQTIDARYDQNLADSIFTRQHLKEIATR